ncbi:hypothetical protein [Bacillus tuaregi]|uniref:hypothetical protein n=1 Tax=Bacillus tuaregi TaxID=1816695 RepID=UPI0008F939B7|nr:hypothetical protein [Bacillus tuaregi]
MEKVFFHPERDKIKNIPVFTNYYQYQAITYFLRVAEHLEPQFTKDLDDIIPLYTETEKIHEMQRENNRSFIDDWDVFEKANTHYNAHLLKLKETIINWAKKYNLVDDLMGNKIFLEIAVWAIPDKRDHPKSVDEWNEFFSKIGRETPRDFLNWSITDPVYIEDECEDVEKVRNDDEIFSGKEFPFLFTPSLQNLYQYKILDEMEDAASDYENIRESYGLDIYYALKGEKEKIGNFTFCEGWDPRNDTWSEFEKMLDVAYKKYKELYRKRTEAHMKKMGYVEGKEKRSLEHFEWLVRYQVQKWNIKEIADHYSKRERVLGGDTIKKALVSTADMVGLQLRK